MHQDQSRRRAVAQDTKALLTTLRGSPQEIADVLAADGLRGWPRDAKGCAIARLLNASLGGHEWVHSITVGTDRVVLRPARRWKRGVSVVLPDPVRAFISDFDAGRFPELTARPGVPVRTEAPSASTGSD